MFKTLPLPPGDLPPEPVIAKKWVRAQVRANVIVDAARARALRIGAAAEARSQQAFADGQLHLERAIRQGYADGYCAALEALSQYWQDSLSLNQRLLDATRDALRERLHETLCSSELMIDMLESILSRKPQPPQRHIKITLPERAAAAANSIRERLARSGLSADIAAPAAHASLEISWGSHVWTFDAAAHSEVLIRAALDDSLDPQDLDLASRRQAASALRTLATSLENGIASAGNAAHARGPDHHSFQDASIPPRDLEQRSHFNFQIS